MESQTYYNPAPIMISATGAHASTSLSTSHGPTPMQKPPKASNAFLLFRNDKANGLFGQSREGHSKQASELWKNADPDVRARYEQLAAVEQAKYEVLMCEWKEKQRRMRNENVLYEQPQASGSHDGVSSSSFDFVCRARDESEPSHSSHDASSLSEVKEYIFLYTTFSESGEEHTSLVPPPIVESTIVETVSTSGHTKKIHHDQVIQSSSPNFPPIIQPIPTRPPPDLMVAMDRWNRELDSERQDITYDNALFEGIEQANEELERYFRSEVQYLEGMTEQESTEFCSPAFNFLSTPHYY